VDRRADSQLRYMPGIDALRAIAVLAVFLYHANVGWLPGGFLGVDVFFVISGYLITSLLLSEYRRGGHIAVGRFWLRRARRLLPAVGVFIAVTLLAAAILVPDQIPQLRGDALASLVYANNWHLIFAHASYFQEFARPSLFQHLWSLAVEEQFYLLWPIAFAAGMSVFGRRRLLFGVIAGALASTLLMALLFHSGSDPSRVYYGTDTRAAPLLVGVALAFVWNPEGVPAKSSAWAPLALDAVGVVALVMVVLKFMQVHDFDPGLYRGGFLILAAWTGLLVAVLAHPSARLGRLLGQRPVLWVGVRSYSFYLWHWPVLMLSRAHIDVPISGAPLVLLQLGTTLVLADLSYRFVEQPFRRPGGTAAVFGRLRLGRPALAAAVLLTVLVIGWGGLFSSSGGGQLQAVSANAATSSAQSSAQASGSVLAASRAPESGAPGPGAPPPDVPVLAVGDSVMEGAAPALRQRLGHRSVVDAAIGRQADQVVARLHKYRAAGELPDYVVIQLGNNGPVWSNQLADLYRALRGVGHVFLVNVEVPRSWEGEANAALAQAAEEEPNTTLVDWHAHAGGGALTTDGVHPTAAGVDVYTSLIANAVRAQAP
jgi:peptidoglycan/LPS O-acetylase OafA/YrhL